MLWNMNSSIFYVWVLVSAFISVVYNFKWFVYWMILVNRCAAKIISRNRVIWSMKLSFWLTSDCLLCKLGIALNLLKCCIVQVRFSLTSQYKITISILSPTPFSPPICFIFLYSSYHHVTLWSIIYRVFVFVFLVHLPWLRWKLF